MKSGSRVFIQNLFQNFWTLLQASTNFESLYYFLEFKTIENDLKSVAQCWAEIRPMASAFGRGGLRTGCVSETARPASARPGAEAALRGVHRVRGRRRLASGRDVARFAVQAPLPSGGGVGQEKRRRGSPRRPVIGGVVGSGWRGGGQRR
jgi:hypothetical protein